MIFIKKDIKKENVNSLYYKNKEYFHKKEDTNCLHFQVSIDTIAMLVCANYKHEHRKGKITESMQLTAVKLNYLFVLYQNEADSHTVSSLAKVLGVTKDDVLAWQKMK